MPMYSAVSLPWPARMVVFITCSALVTALRGVAAVAACLNALGGSMRLGATAARCAVAVGAPLRIAKNARAAIAASGSIFFMLKIICVCIFSIVGPQDVGRCFA